MIYLQEIVAIDRGGKEAYLESVRTRWAPYAERSRGMRLVWLGSTIGSTGEWPETIAVWELRDWRHYAEVCARMYTESSDDAELASWWREASKIRLRSRSQTLVAASFSPTFDDLSARGVAGTAFAFSTYHVRPRAMARFLRAFKRHADEAGARGRRLVGAYEVAFTNHLAYAIWAHRSLDEMTSYESRRENARLAGCERWSEHWGFAVPGSPLWPRDETRDARVW
jgi:hypothetical protein